MRYEIAQKWDFQNIRTAIGLESKRFTQTNGGFESIRYEPTGVCWKSENNENRFENLRDDNDVID